MSSFGYSLTLTENGSVTKRFVIFKYQLFQLCLFNTQLKSTSSKPSEALTLK